MRWSVLIVCLLVLGACGDDPEPPAGPSTIEKADAYAKELSGGQTEGCSTAKPGPESERNPGCIYGVAFAGCRDALEGSRDAIEEAVAIRDEFPKEPRLWKVYDKAVKDCASL
jgi:hypothetical protein